MPKALSISHGKCGLFQGQNKLEGKSKKLWPGLECQRCGHDVSLEKYQRFWLDLDQQALFGSGLCQNLRTLSQQWSALLGASVGLRTINERINQLAPLAQQAHKEPLGEVPPVVQFDGIWLRLQTATDTVKLDIRHRSARSMWGKKWCCWLRQVCGPMAVVGGKFSIGDWPKEKAKQRGSHSCSGCGNGAYVRRRVSKGYATH